MKKIQNLTWSQKKRKKKREEDTDGQDSIYKDMRQKYICVMGRRKKSCLLKVAWS
jgi:hypothetical protein